MNVQPTSWDWVTRVFMAHWFICWAMGVVCILYIMIFDAGKVEIIVWPILAVIVLGTLVVAGVMYPAIGVMLLVDGIYSPMVVAFIIYLIIMSGLLRRWIRKDRCNAMVAMGLYCKQCGYDIRASTGSCPECGETILQTTAEMIKYKAQAERDKENSIYL